MKTVKGSGLVASVLTLLHGVYLAIYFLWVLVYILAGVVDLAPPILNPLGLAILDTVVYLFLGARMLLGRRSYFVYAILWTIWGALIATFVATYKGSLLNLLSFLIVLSCTYYHVSVNRINIEVARVLGQFAGVLALVQGIIVASAFLYAYILQFREWIILVPPFDQLRILGLDFMVIAAVTTFVYLVLGVGMLRGKKEFFFIAIFWTIVESALVVVNSSYSLTHYNFISMLILAFGTYRYFAKAST